MELSDIIILSFLFIGLVIGSARGLSGEISSIIKLSVALIICIIITGYLEKNLGVTINRHGYIIFSVFITIYILIGFILGILLIPLVSFLRIFIPIIIDKALGAFTAFIKNAFILLIFSNIILLINKGATPYWLNNSMIFAEIKKYEINLADSIGKIQNFDFFQLPFLKKLDNPEQESQSDKDKSDNSIGNKVEDMMVIIDHYKKLKNFESDNKKDSMDDMEQLIEELQ